MAREPAHLQALLRVGVLHIGALLLGLVAFAPPLARAEDDVPGSGAPSASPPSPPEALARLSSPFLAEREGAVADLLALGASARPAVLAAFARAGPDRRPELVRVLAADGSPEALHALLEALRVTTDAATTTAIQQSLVEHAERVADAVHRWRDAKGRVPKAVEELDSLLVRARVEAKFLSRKSQSGSTGSYAGQFEVLLPDRRRAVEICLDLLLDRPTKFPGRYPAGGFRFLRPPPFLVDRSELQEMAIRAIAELATPADVEVVDALENLYVDLRRRLDAATNWRVQQAIIGFSDSLLPAIVRLRRNGPLPPAIVDDGTDAATWIEHANEVIENRNRREDTRDDAAALALQLNDFPKAVSLYEKLRRTNKSGLAAYNHACALAKWSQAGGSAGRSAELLREQALNAIEQAYESGYLDWAWMTEDRDLAAIHETPRFRALVERMKLLFKLRPVERPAEPEPPAPIPVPYEEEPSPDVPPPVPPSPDEPQPPPEPAAPIPVDPPLPTDEPPAPPPPPPPERAPEGR